jgi:hypothetical protein
MKKSKIIHQSIYLYIDRDNDVYEVFHSHKEARDFGDDYYEGEEGWDETGYVNIYKRKIRGAILNGCEAT